MAQGPVSTRVEDRMGRPQGAVSILHVLLARHWGGGDGGGAWRMVASGCVVGGWVAASAGFDKVSVHPESNQGPSDICLSLQSDALPTEL